MHLCLVYRSFMHQHGEVWPPLNLFVVTYRDAPILQQHVGEITWAKAP